MVWLVVLTLELGPPVAGLVLTGLVSGRAGYAGLLARLGTWRVDARWYAVALLTAPIVATAVLLVLSLTSQAYVPGILVTSDWMSLLLVGLVTGLLGGFGEELGWTGFATPRLRLRHSVVATGLFMGVLWGVWHFLVTPAWIAGTYSGEIPLAAFLIVNGVLALVGYLTPYRVLMVWVYDRSGSLLLASLMHASLIASTLFLLAPATMEGMVYITWSMTLAAAFWIALAAFRVATGPLSRPNPGDPAGVKDAGADVTSIPTKGHTDLPRSRGKKPVSMKVFSAVLVQQRARRGTSSHSRIEVILGAFLALDGLAVVGLWMVSLSSGAFGGITGLLVYQDGNYPVLHVTAELLMGTLAVVSGVGLMARQAWARALALFALGMLAYSSINSAGWPIKNNPNLLVPMFATAGPVVLALPTLLRRTTPARSD